MLARRRTHHEAPGHSKNSNQRQRWESPRRSRHLEPRLIARDEATAIAVGENRSVEAPVFSKLKLSRQRTAALLSPRFAFLGSIVQLVVRVSAGGCRAPTLMMDAELTPSGSDSWIFSSVSLAPFVYQQTWLVSC